MKNIGENTEYLIYCIYRVYKKFTVVKSRLNLTFRNVCENFMHTSIV